MSRLKLHIKSVRIKKFYFYYNSFIFNKFIKSTIKNGRQVVFLKIILLLFKLIKLKLRIIPIIFLHMFIQKSCNPIELFSIKKSGRILQLGKPIKLPRQLKTSIKLFTRLAFRNKKMRSYLYLFNELNYFFFDKNKSELVKSQNTLFKIAIQNQPNVNYRLELKKHSHFFKNLKRSKRRYFKWPINRKIKPSFSKLIIFKMKNLPISKLSSFFFRRHFVYINLNYGFVLRCTKLMSKKIIIKFWFLFRLMHYSFPKGKLSFFFCYKEPLKFHFKRFKLNKKSIAFINYYLACLIPFFIIGKRICFYKKYYEKYVGSFRFSNKLYKKRFNFRKQNRYINVFRALKKKKIKAIINRRVFYTRYFNICSKLNKFTLIKSYLLIFMLRFIQMLVINKFKYSYIYHRINFVILIANLSRRLKYINKSYDYSPYTARGKFFRKYFNRLSRIKKLKLFETSMLFFSHLMSLRRFKIRFTFYNRHYYQKSMLKMRKNFLNQERHKIKNFFFLQNVNILNLGNYSILSYAKHARNFKFRKLYYLYKKKVPSRVINIFNRLYILFAKYYVLMTIISKKKKIKKLSSIKKKILLLTSDKMIRHKISKRKILTLLKPKIIFVRITKIKILNLSKRKFLLFIKKKILFFTKMIRLKLKHKKRLKFIKVIKRLKAVNESRLQFNFSKNIKKYSKLKFSILNSKASFFNRI